MKKNNHYGCAQHLLKIEQNAKHYRNENHILKKIRLFSKGAYCEIHYYRIQESLLGNTLNRIMYQVDLFDQSGVFCASYRSEASQIHIETISENQILIITSVDDYIIFNTDSGEVHGYYFLGNNPRTAMIEHLSLSKDKKSLALGLKTPFNQDECVIFDIQVFPFDLYTPIDFNIKHQQCRLVGWMDSVLLVHTAGKYHELDLQLLNI